MTQIVRAFVGAQIHDGQRTLEDHALIETRDGLVNVLSRDKIPAECPIDMLDGGIIAPGFVDLQVNGGGGIMFNDDQSVDTLRTITQAHASTGTAGLLPTLITDNKVRTRAAIDAVDRAIRENVDGILGIHLEGPHLSVSRKGAHDRNLIRPMDEEDLQLLLSAADRLPNVMVTVAPENTTLAQIKTMSDAGIVVSLGHTDADFRTCMTAFDAGAKCVTHLFNAMSQMGNREPGLVGATLARDDVYAGLIADGIHVHPAMVRIALAAKRNPERIFLVTDAMATAGSSIKGFMLNNREVIRRNKSLTLKDGTLAGADLDIPQAVSVMTDQAGDTQERAIARATGTPASLLRQPNGFGRFPSTLQTAVYFKGDQSGSLLNRS